MTASAARHVYTDRDDLRAAVAEHILAHSSRRLALRRASAETIATWLLIGRSTLFSTLVRLELSLGDLQRCRV